MMIREKVTNKGTSGNKGFMLIVMVSASVILLSTIIGYIQNTFGIRHLEYIIYAGLIVFSIFLMRKYITEYRYSFFDDEIIIEKMLGNRITPVANIRTWNIQHFGKFSDSDWKDENLKVDFYDVERKDASVMVCKDHNGMRAIVFNPSVEFVDQLQKTMKDNQKGDNPVIVEEDIVTT